MSDDSLLTALSGFSGAAAGIRDVLVPIMTAKYQQKLDIEKLRVSKGLDEIPVEQIPNYETLFPGVPVGTRINKALVPYLTQTAKPQRQGQHLFIDKTTGETIRAIPSTAGTGDTITQIGQSEEEKQAGKNRANLQKGLPAAKASIDKVNTDIDEAVGLIDNILHSPGLGKATGTYFGRSDTSLIPAAQNTISLVNSLRAKAGWEAFKDLKATSPSGTAGVGSLSDSERTALEQASATLDRKQQTPEFARNLGLYRDKLLRSKTRLNNKFSEEFADVVTMPQVGAQRTGGEPRINPKVRIKAGNTGALTLPQGVNLPQGRHTDAQGNTIMVYPDGTYDEE